MKTWKIPVIWTVNGIVEIEADTLGEALSEAEYSDCALPEGDYVGDSSEVDNCYDEEDIRELYNDGQEDELEEIEE